MNYEKILGVLMAILMVTSVFGFAFVGGAAAYDADDVDTSEPPSPYEYSEILDEIETDDGVYEVSNVVELQALNYDGVFNDENATVKLADDIDASDTHDWHTATVGLEPHNGDVVGEEDEEGGVEHVYEEFESVTVYDTDNEEIDESDYEVEHEDDEELIITFEEETEEEKYVQIEYEDPVGFSPIGSFSEDLVKADFDGQNYAIEDIHVNVAEPTTGYSGAIGMIGGDDQYIENIDVIDAEIEAPDDDLWGVGFIAGDDRGDAKTFQNLTVTGDFEGGMGVSAIFGDHNGGDLHMEDINVDASVTTFDDGYSGLLVGGDYGDTTTVTDTTVKGDITAVGDYSGGLFGQVMADETTVTNTAVDVDIEGEEHVGAFFGYAEEETTIEDSYGAGSLDGDYKGMIIGEYGDDEEDDELFTEDVYIDSEALDVDELIYTDDDDNADGQDVTELDTDEMQGSAAEENMNIDFDEVWHTVEDHHVGGTDYPAIDRPQVGISVDSLDTVSVASMIPFMDSDANGVSDTLGVEEDDSVVLDVSSVADFTDVADDTETEDRAPIQLHVDGDTLGVYADEAPEDVEDDAHAVFNTDEGEITMENLDVDEEVDVTATPDSDYNVLTQISEFGISEVIPSSVQDFLPF